jgi:hypothetical protein
VVVHADPDDLGKGVSCASFVVLWSWFPWISESCIHAAVEEVHLPFCFHFSLSSIWIYFKSEFLFICMSLSSMVIMTFWASDLGSCIWPCSRWPWIEQEHWKCGWSTGLW